MCIRDRYRAVRGFISARLWGIDNAASSDPNVVFRPVLEILNPDTLGSDGLKVVTLDPVSYTHLEVYKRQVI